MFCCQCSNETKLIPPNESEEDVVVEVVEIDDDNSEGSIEEVCVVEHRHEIIENNSYNYPNGLPTPKSANTSVNSGYPMMQPYP